MNAASRRFALYGTAAVLVAGLAWSNGRVDDQTDVMTLLSGAEVQLRFAHRMPDADKDGAPLPARAELVATAERFLADAERVHPGLAVTAEFQGFAAMLRGDFGAAAAAYRRARACSDCAEEQRDILSFNEARMLAQAGDGAGALAVLGQHGVALDARFGRQRQLAEAGALRQLGRMAEATARLEGVLADPAAQPVERLEAAQALAALGAKEPAAIAFAATACDEPISEYFLAKLKLERGEVDSSLDLLERASAAQPAEVKRLLRNEADVWSAVAANVRFQKVSDAEPAAPAR
jgi:hypothetical protein